MNLKTTVLVALLGAGCIPFGDPEGPGATGTITLAAGVDPAAFKTLVVVAVPDDGRPFDAGALPKPALDQTSRSSLEGTSFPVVYSVGGALGTSSVQRWRLVAWLSRATAGDAVAPAPTDPICSARYSVQSCGSFGGFCHVSGGVDCTIAPR